MIEDIFVVASRTWCNEVNVVRIDHGMREREVRSCGASFNKRGNFLFNEGRRYRKFDGEEKLKGTE
jgi:hypothetical protein